MLEAAAAAAVTEVAAPRSQLGAAAAPHSQVPGGKEHKGKNAALRFLSGLRSKKEKYQAKGRGLALQVRSSAGCMGRGESCPGPGHWSQLRLLVECLPAGLPQLVGLPLHIPHAPQPTISEDTELGPEGDKGKRRTLAGKLLGRGRSKGGKATGGDAGSSTGSLDRLAFGSHQLTQQGQHTRCGSAEGARLG